MIQTGMSKRAGGLGGDGTADSHLGLTGADSAACSAPNVCCKIPHTCRARERHHVDLYDRAASDRPPGLRSGSGSAGSVRYAVTSVTSAPAAAQGLR